LDNKNIMKIENQVCSLELAKKLKELGVKQNSLFYWETGAIKPKVRLSVVTEIEFKLESTQKYDTSDCRFLCSAFTVAELGEMLPKSIKYGGKNVPLEYRGKNCFGEHLVAYHINFESPIGLQCEKTEANARAKMLIYLLENDLLKL